MVCDTTGLCLVRFCRFQQTPSGLDMWIWPMSHSQSLGFGSTRNSQNLLESSRSCGGVCSPHPLLSFGSPDRGKIQRAEWSYTEARRGQVFRTMEMPQCRVRTWLQLMCCALDLELGVLISEQQKVAGKGEGVMEWKSDGVVVCWSGGVTEQRCDGARMES